MSDWTINETHQGTPLRRSVIREVCVCVSVCAGGDDSKRRSRSGCNHAGNYCYQCDDPSTMYMAADTCSEDSKNHRD